MSANTKECGTVVENPLLDLDKPFAEEGYVLMGAAFEVHRELGGGLLEEIYQQCLEIELELRRIPFIPNQELTVQYKGRQIRKKYLPDLVVNGHIVVELKSVKQLIPDHESQLLNYMRITRQSVGYLINFAPMDKVEWKRFVLSEFLRNHH